MTALVQENENRFIKLTESLEGPVQIAVLRNFLFGAIDPNSFMPCKPEVPGAFAYTDDERARVLDIAEQNLARIKNLPPVAHPFLLVSGGGPGSGKSTVLFQKVAAIFHIEPFKKIDWAEPSLQKVMEKIFFAKDGAPVALVAPDRKALLQLALHDHGTSESNEQFYKHNRAATNFLSLFEMDAGFTHKQNIVWDTTLGSLGALSNLNYAKEHGYSVVALLQGAPLDTRQTSVDDRAAGGFFQCLPSNIREQDATFGNNIPAILGATDTVILNWRDKKDQPSREIAVVASHDLEKQWIVGDTNAFGKLRELYPKIGDDHGVFRPTNGAAAQALENKPK